MGRAAGWTTKVTGRQAMRSPGRPVSDRETAAAPGATPWRRRGTRGRSQRRRGLPGVLIECRGTGSRAACRTRRRTGADRAGARPRRRPRPRVRGRSARRTGRRCARCRASRRRHRRSAGAARPPDWRCPSPSLAEQPASRERANGGGRSTRTVQHSSGLHDCALDPGNGGSSRAVRLCA